MLGLGIASAHAPVMFRVVNYIPAHSTQTGCGFACSPADSATGNCD